MCTSYRDSGIIPSTIMLDRLEYRICLDVSLGIWFGSLVVRMWHIGSCMSWISATTATAASTATMSTRVMPWGRCWCWSRMMPWSRTRCWCWCWPMTRWWIRWPCLEVSLVDGDSLLASDLFPDSTFLVSVAVPWQSCLFRGHSPILVS